MKIGDRIKRCEHNEIGILVNINPNILLLDTAHLYVYVRPTEQCTILEEVDKYKPKLVPKHVLCAIQNMYDEDINIMKS